MTRQTTLGTRSSVFLDAKTNRLYVPNSTEEPAFSYNMYSRTYQMYGYDGYIYQNDDMGRQNQWRPVGYSEQANPAYLSTLDYGSLSNQSVTARSFWAINDLYTNVTRVQGTAHSAGQTNYAAEGVPVDAAGEPVGVKNAYQVKINNTAVGFGGNRKWRLVPVKDSYDTAYDSGAVRLQNLQTGEYLQANASTAAAQRAFGAKLITGDQQPAFDPDDNDGYGAAGGSDQWYLLPVAADKPAVLRKGSTPTKIAKATGSRYH